MNKDEHHPLGKLIRFLFRAICLFPFMLLAHIGFALFFLISPKIHKNMVINHATSLLNEKLKEDLKDAKTKTEKP